MRGWQPRCGSCCVGGKGPPEDDAATSPRTRRRSSMRKRQPDERRLQVAFVAARVQRDPSYESEVIVLALSEKTEMACHLGSSPIERQLCAWPNAAEFSKEQPYRDRSPTR